MPRTPCGVFVFCQAEKFYKEQLCIVITFFPTYLL